MIDKVTETGQDRLSIAWRESPPLFPLKTIADCARDFKRLYPETGDRDLVAEFTAEAGSWEEAVDRACRSRGANGKMYNHQSRVPLATLLEYRDRIRRRLGDGEYQWPQGPLTFDWLHDRLEEVRPKGIGPVTTYDVAWRLACWLGIAPTSLYLHAGVTDGVKALGLPVRGRKRITRDEMIGTYLAEALAVLKDVNTLEDFLCCYRRVFPVVLAEEPDWDDDPPQWD